MSNINHTTLKCKDKFKEFIIRWLDLLIVALVMLIMLILAHIADIDLSDSFVNKFCGVLALFCAFGFYNNLSKFKKIEDEVGSRYKDSELRDIPQNYLMYKFLIFAFLSTVFFLLSVAPNLGEGYFGKIGVVLFILLVIISQLYLKKDKK